MALTNEHIRIGFENFVLRVAPASILQAKVVAVNDGDATVDVTLPGGAQLPDVRIRSLVKSGDRFVMLPAVDSEVLIGKIAGQDEYVVLAMEAITEVKSIIGTTTVSWDASGLLVKKGSDGLREIITDLITEIQAIYAPKNVANIAAIQVRFNQLLTAI